MPDIQIWMINTNRGLGLTFFKAMTFIGKGGLGIVYFVIYYSFSSRERAFYFLFVYGIAMSFNYEMKMIYHHPRPYMSSDSV